MLRSTHLVHAAPRRTSSRRSAHGLPALAVLVAALAGACESPLPPGETPLAPESCSSVPEQTVPHGGSSSVQVCFSDENGDRLSLSARSSNNAVAAVATGDSTVMLTGVRPGTATVMVTATDPGGLSGVNRHGKCPGYRH